MIRTVALGVICLAGLVAIAAAAKKPALPQHAEVVFPKVDGNKADRLPLIPRLDTPADVEKVDVESVTPAPVEALSEPAAPQKAASQPLPRIVARHWHDPHDRKFFGSTKQGAGKSKSPTNPSADRTTKRFADAKECRSEGLDCTTKTEPIATVRIVTTGHRAYASTSLQKPKAVDISASVAFGITDLNGTNSE